MPFVFGTKVCTIHRRATGSTTRRMSFRRLVVFGWAVVVERWAEPKDQSQRHARIMAPSQGNVANENGTRPAPTTCVRPEESAS
jgi:hypothetical protein